jgi:hypothetical protein
MSKSLAIVILGIATLAMIVIIAGSSLEIKDAGAIMSALGGLVGVEIAYLFFNDKKKRGMAAGVLFITFYFTMKLLLLPYYYVATFEADLRKAYPLLNVIAENYPVEFNQYIKASRQYILEKGGRYNDMLLSSQLINMAVAKAIPYASNESTYKLLTVLINTYKKLYALNPMYVLLLEFPDRSPDKVMFDKLESVLTQADINQLMEAKKEIIISGLDNQGRKIQLTDPKFAAAKEVLNRIMIMLDNQYGEKIFKDTFVTKTPGFIDPSQSGDLIITMYEQIAAQGEDQGGLVFKTLFN